MNKHRFSSISYLLLVMVMVIGYTQCNCKPASPTSDPDPASDNTDKPPAITQAMIDQVKADLVNDADLQFLVDGLEELQKNNKSNIDLQNGNFNSCTALHHAAYGGYPDIVAALLQLGAVATLKATANFTPFNLTIKRGQQNQTEIIDIFLNDPHIADFINIPQDDGKTPLANVTDKIDTLELTKAANDPEVLKWSKIKQDLIHKGATT